MLVLDNRAASIGQGVTHYWQRGGVLACGCDWNFWTITPHTATLTFTIQHCEAGRALLDKMRHAEQLYRKSLIEKTGGDHNLRALYYECMDTYLQHTAVEDR